MRRAFPLFIATFFVAHSGRIAEPAARRATPYRDDLSDFAKIPASNSHPPLAGINYLLYAGDGSGRLFVNDMRRKVYAVAPGKC